METIAGTHKLASLPAASWRRMQTAGMPSGGINSAYRSPVEQERIFLARYRPQVTGSGSFGDVRFYRGVRYVRHSAAGMVAVPGTSKHNTGYAIDMATASAAHQWMLKNAGAHGWRRTIASEPWHWEYNSALDRNKHLPQHPPKPTSSKGIFGMAKHAKFDHKKKQQLSADKKYKILRIEDGRSYIVAGGAKFTGQIIVVFDDLAPDQTAMIRVFRGGYKKGATPAVASGRTITWQEVTGTTGKTFATVPITGAINADYGNGRATRLYVQAKLNSGPATPLTISRVIIEALHD